MRFFQRTPPSRRKFEKAIGWTILVLACLAVPHTHGTLLVRTAIRISAVGHIRGEIPANASNVRTSD